MKTILLQDDPELLRRLECSLLRREGVRLLLGGGEALQATAARERPDLVVLGPAAAAGGGLIEALRSLPHAPACLVLQDELMAETPGQVGDHLLAEAGGRLGLAGRRQQRRPCRLQAAVTGAGETRKGTSRDLSESGVFIVMERPFAPHQDVQVELMGSGGQPARRILGAVARSRSGKAASLQVPGMGVHFRQDQILGSAEVDSLSAVGCP